MRSRSTSTTFTYNPVGHHRSILFNDLCFTTWVDKSEYEQNESFHCNKGSHHQGCLRVTEGLPTKVMSIPNQYIHPVRLHEEGSERQHKAEGQHPHPQEAQLVRVLPQKRQAGEVQEDAAKDEGPGEAHVARRHLALSSVLNKVSKEDQAHNSAAEGGGEDAHCLGVGGADGVLAPRLDGAQDEDPPLDIVAGRSKRERLRGVDGAVKADGH